MHWSYVFLALACRYKAASWYWNVATVKEVPAQIERLSKDLVRTEIPGPHLNIKTVFPGTVISFIKIRRSWDRLIFIHGIPILVRRHLYIEMDPQILISALDKPGFITKTHTGLSPVWNIDPHIYIYIYIYVIVLSLMIHGCDHISFRVWTWPRLISSW